MIGITEAQLRAQWDTAIAHWPFIPAVEANAGLPPFLLGAVGSRETNLVNEAGDYYGVPRIAHGYGVWQRDIQHPGVGPDYLNNVYAQAVDAANLLISNYRVCQDWRGACAMYNSGQTDDRYTTGGNYGADVMSRLAVLWSDYGTSPWLRADVRAIQTAVHAVPDGIWGPDTQRRVLVVRSAACHFPYDVRYLQLVLNARIDGIPGAETFLRLFAALKGIQAGLHVPVDGIWGPMTENAYVTASPYV